MVIRSHDGFDAGDFHVLGTNKGKGFGFTHGPEFINLGKYIGFYDG